MKGRKKERGQLSYDDADDHEEEESRAPPTMAKAFPPRTTEAVSRACRTATKSQLIIPYNTPHRCKGKEGNHSPRLPRIHNPRIHLDAHRGNMPSTPGQLAPLIPPFLGHIPLAVPANILLGVPNRQPEPLHQMTRLRIHIRHLTEEKRLQQILIQCMRVAADGIPVDGEEGAGLEGDGVGHGAAGEKVLPVFTGRHGGCDALHGGPLLPARVVGPGDAGPVVEELELAEGEGGDVARRGGEGALLELAQADGDVVVDVALQEDGHVGQGVVVGDDVVQVGVPFAPDVGQGVAGRGRGVGVAAFAVDGGVGELVFEPGEVFVVVGDYHFVGFVGGHFGCWGGGGWIGRGRVV